MGDQESGVAGNRRERQRASTLAEIKAAARELMLAEGCASLSLSAVARRINLSQPGMYRYFPNRDALVTELIAEGYTSLAQAHERAVAEVLDRDPSALAAAFESCGVAYRRWALEHSAEFGLIFGDPIPGYQAPAGGPTDAAAGRAFLPFARLLEQGPRRTPTPSTPSTPSTAATDVSELPAALAGELTRTRERFAAAGYDVHLPATALADWLSAWARMHGLISLEVFGHLQPFLSDPGLLYRHELAAIVTDLRLPGT